MNAMAEAATPSHGLAEAVLEAQRRLATAATPQGLRATAKAIADAAASTGCTALVPASASSRGAVAAAVLLGDGALTQAEDADVLSGVVCKVLVVEVAAVSGLHVRRRVEALRSAGAAWIGLVVLHDVRWPVDRTPADDRFGVVDHFVQVA